MFKANIKKPSIPFTSFPFAINCESNNSFQYYKMVKVVKSAAEFQQALKFVGLTVVDFYATWCGPCKMIAPLLEKFSTEYSNVNFIKVDVDESGDIAQQYEVSSMPTLIFFKNGEIVQKVIGANPSAIKQAIASNA